jgi:hypothetical protein
MEAENAWVRAAPRLGDSISTWVHRVRWISFYALLPLLRLLPLGQHMIHRSLFQTIMANNLRYDRLHAAVKAAPAVWAVLMAVGWWGVHKVWCGLHTIMGV